ncbi:MAG: hypothetical protein V4633_11360 [Pseudomonadota bacterium]
MPVYVQHEVLGKVNDVFNAEAIWQAPGLALFSRRPLLRDLLERSPRELRGRAPVRCFSHITLMLAQEELDDDRHLTRGARLRDLTESLTALHRKDFGDLLGSDDVRYDVVGTEALEPGEVEVKFGHAVYLPVASERVLYKVLASADGTAWESVCPMYLNQRLALIGQGGHTAPCWPFGAEGAILLVNDGPEAPIEVQVRPRNAFDCTLEDDVYTITSKRGPSQASLLLKVERVQVPVKPKAAVWKARAPDAELTAVAESDATFAPVMRQGVTLVALALPRLSRYRETGATGMEIGLDHSLALCAAGIDPAIRLSVDADDHLHAVTSTGREAITAPASIGKVELLAVAPAMADRYCATLMLPHPASVPVTQGARLVFGRSAPMLSNLRVLDSPRFLQRGDGPDNASADRIGLSRSAFSFEAGPDGFTIGRLSATQALYHLDQDLAFVASLSDQPYLLPPGHHLVAGHYVLRFDA